MTDKEIQTVESLRKDGILSLKDAQGNPRFVEGDITMETIEGITQTYGKWSLSGTHLMIVAAGSITNDTVINSTTLLLNVELPNYIMDKIVPVFATNYIEIKTFITYSNDWTSQAITLQTAKANNRFIVTTSGSKFTATKDRSFRIQFDLLIDADYD